MASCAVELRSVWASLGGAPVLRGVSLCVPRGGYLVVLGPSGSGKTTLLRLVAGLVEAERGGVFIDGVDASGLPPWERGVALVQQVPGLLPHLSILENVVLAAVSRTGVSRREALEEAERILELLRISRVAGKKPGELSGGQLQRAAIAVALAVKPRVLLLDEPLSHLDRPLAEQLRLELRRLHRRLGVTVVHVTHDQDEALSLATRLAILWEGRVVEEGEPDQLYYSPRSIISARFLGLNVINARVLGRPGLLAVFPPEAVRLVDGGGLEAYVREVVRERGRVILYARLAETGEVIRAYIHPRELSRIRAERISVNIDEELLRFMEPGEEASIATNS